MSPTTYHNSSARPQVAHAIECDSLALIEATAAQILPLEIRNCFESVDGAAIAPRSKRENEFASGRRAAQSLLAQFGETSPVGVASDRSPIWPRGFAGSISHSDHLIWAAVAQQIEIQSLGIDTERIVDSKTHSQLRQEIATSDEWAIANSLGHGRETTFTLVFSAKEALYKCCYPLTGTYFGFLDVAVTAFDENKIRIHCGNANAQSQPQAGSENVLPTNLPASLDVHYFVHKQDVFTATWIDPSAVSHQK